jgi:dihydropteroate synthase
MPSLRQLLDCRRGALIMGVLNVTPDSFSDGGRFMDPSAAARRIDELVAEGADIIDIGAESTRPGSAPIAAAEQIARIGATIRLAVQRGTVVSIDTTSAEVAERALQDGARIINSVSLDPAAELGRLAAHHGAALVLMHSRGPMSKMRGFSAYPDDGYGDVVREVGAELTDAAERALAAGLPHRELMLDPGLGFAKNARQSLALCARLEELGALGFPLVVGPSRKSFLEIIAKDERVSPPADRLGGTVAAVLACVARGARVVRVHDVAIVRQALLVSDAIAHDDPDRSEGVARA